MIVIRNQVLSPDQQVAFFRRFGPLTIHVLEEHLLAGYLEILLVTNEKEKRQYLGISDLGRQWHTDQSYQEAPALDPLLYALEVPGDGSGDKYFADMTAPYEALSPDERERLDDLQAEHRYDRKHENFKLSDYQVYHLPGVSHPLVRTHPEIGRKALYLGALLVKRIIGISPDDSAKILERLYAHCAQSTFGHRHKWRKDDRVFWDNHCTMHAAQPYYDQRYTRHMHRTTVGGDRPC